MIMFGSGKVKFLMRSKLDKRQADSWMQKNILISQPIFGRNILETGLMRVCYPGKNNLEFSNPV